MRDTLFAMRRLLPLAILLLSSACTLAQTSLPTPPDSHQVNPDHTITFRYIAPGARKVLLGLDAYPKPLPMTKDAAGIWSVTTPVLPPEFYEYEFIADGITTLDPLNDSTVKNYVSLGSSVLLPGTPSEPWELAAVPHGRVDHKMYTTHVALHLPLNQESYMVYTPPGYDPNKKGGYPVLYLLHGWSDSEYGWTDQGHAENILDSLEASGKAVPMIVVMPLGYGDLDFVDHGFGVWREPAKVSANVALFGQMLLTEIIPAVEHEYNVAPGRDNRALAGLSMGGLETLVIGLNHTDTFSYLGGMSAAVFGGKDDMFNAYIPNLDAKKANLHLLWIGCGKTDGLITGNRDFVAWTKAKGFDTVAVETPGAHTWLTWRDNLVHLAPLLFQSK